MKTRVLVIEDNKTVARMVAQGVGNRYGIAVDIVGSLAEARELLEENTNYLLALCDLNLPDAPNGEAIEILLDKKITTIVMTAMVNTDLRRDIISKPIADYVNKDHPEDIEYIIERVGEINRNSKIKILVVDDSALARSIMIRLLRVQKFVVFEAENGQIALNTIEKHPDIRVVITDYNMPVMDGLKLTIELRRQFRREQLAIIAISSESDSSISSHLLKLGASDFIHKPFIKEEFDCRINNTVRSLENLDKMFNLANKDYLTGLYNRLYFYSTINEYVNTAIDTKEKFAVAMLDLDDFKQINDKHGHEAGDLVLKAFSTTLLEHIRGADVAVRFGGEEFCVVLKDVAEKNAHKIFDTFRESIANKLVNLPKGIGINFSVSIGITADTTDGINAMINQADKRLYKAKLWGKNRVCSDGE